jgi:hypothetical protein
MTVLAHLNTKWIGQSRPLRPGNSDVHLFRYGEGIINLNAKVTDRALDLPVSEQELHRAQIAGKVAFVRHSEWVPNKCGSSPMLAIHSKTSRAYCLVVMLFSERRRPANINSPDLLTAHLR